MSFSKPTSTGRRLALYFYLLSIGLSVFTVMNGTTSTVISLPDQLPLRSPHEFDNAGLSKRAGNGRGGRMSVSKDIRDVLTEEEDALSKRGSGRGGRMSVSKDIRDIAESEEDADVSKRASAGRGGRMSVSNDIRNVAESEEDADLSKRGRGGRPVAAKVYRDIPGEEKDADLIKRLVGSGRGGRMSVSKDIRSLGPNSDDEQPQESSSFSISTLLFQQAKHTLYLVSVVLSIIFAASSLSASEAEWQGRRILDLSMGCFAFILALHTAGDWTLNVCKMLASEGSLLTFSETQFVMVHGGSILSIWISVLAQLPYLLVSLVRHKHSDAYIVLSDKA